MRLLKKGYRFLMAAFGAFCLGAWLYATLRGQVMGNLTVWLRGVLRCFA